MNSTWFMREIKEKELSRLYDSIEIKNPSILEFNNCSLFPLGPLYDIKQYNTQELIIDDNDYCTRISFDNSEKVHKTLKGVTLYGGYLRKIWGHFLMGGLSRLWTVVNRDFLKTIDNVLFFTNEINMLSLTGNYLEIMELLGIADKLIICKDENIKTEKLIVPEISFEHDVFNSKACHETFDYIISQAMKDFTPAQKNRKVFFTRRYIKDGAKNEINLKKLEKVFEQNGFEIIAPEKLSMTSLIRTLSETSILASPSGSTAHNIVFTKWDSDRQFFILERHGWNNTFQANINKMLNIKAVHIDAFWMPRLSSSQDFVFFYGFTPQLIRFFKIYNLKLQITSQKIEKIHKEGLRKYMLRHRRYYGNAESIEPWEITTAQTLAEAIVDTRLSLPKWLIESRPILWYDFITIRFYLRNIKRLYIKAKNKINALFSQN